MSKQEPVNQLASTAEINKAREADKPEVEVEDRYDKDGHLTRKGMEAVVAEGGSVSFDGKTINKAQDIPTASDIKESKDKSQSMRRP